MKKFGKIVTLGALVLALNGCSNPRSAIDNTVQKTSSLLNQGVGRQLSVRISEPYKLRSMLEDVSGAEEIVFIDSNGDGKTVEHYAVRYLNSRGFPLVFGLKQNLLRQGAKPILGPYDIKSYEIGSIGGKAIEGHRLMTKEEMAQIDSKYQALLGLYAR